MSANPDIERLLIDQYARQQPPKILPPVAAMQRDFRAIGDDRYQMTIANIGVTLEVDRLRRERNELVGELSANCTLPGAYTYDGSLSIADFNLSSARARLERAKLLSFRANTRESVDWNSIVEEFCQRVLKAERDGQPAVDLRTLPLPDKENSSLSIQGFPILRRHPTVLFGDGGAAKSYLALYFAGLLAEQGYGVALFDWELSGEDHRDRLGRLFPDGMPRILYARCDRPLAYEADRLRRIVKQEGIEFCIFDSVAFACDGPPESAEVAGRYFRAARQIGGGSLHIAHINKGENSEQKPFGSAFWHNGARATWYAQRAEDTPDGSIIRVGLFNRKTNLGALRRPVGFTVTFTDDQTTFRRSEVSDSPELAQNLTIYQRIYSELRSGAMSPDALAEELGLDPESVKRTIRRKKDKFIVLPGGLVGLLERRSDA
jgi:DNA-binding CsgD family transcriptional regulator